MGKCEYIKGIEQTLADTMSRLIDMDPDNKQESEHLDHECGYYVFEQLIEIDIQTQYVREHVVYSIDDATLFMMNKCIYL